MLGSVPRGGGTLITAGASRARVAATGRLRCLIFTQLQAFDEPPARHATLLADGPPQQQDPTAQHSALDQDRPTRLHWRAVIRCRLNHPWPPTVGGPAATQAFAEALLPANLAGRRQRAEMAAFE